MLKAKRIVMELDVTKLDEPIDAEEIQEIGVRYENIGEGDEWSESVPFVIKEVEEYDPYADL